MRSELVFSWFTICLLLLGVSAKSQQVSPSVRGSIVDVTTQRPIADAKVEIDGRSTYSAATGEFTLATLRPGQHIMSVSGQGYVNASLAKELGELGDDGSHPIQVQTAEGNTSDVIVFLFPPSVLLGNAFDATGQAVVRARVIPYRFLYDRNGKRQLQEVGGTFTDDVGAFRITLPQGKYIIEIRQSLPEGDLRGSFLSGFYPGTLEGTRATEVALKAGSETRLSPIVLSAVRSSIVDVRPVNERGATVSAIPLIRETVTRGIWNPGQLQSSGFYRFMLVPGQYEIKAHQSMNVSGPTLLDAREGNATFDLVLTRGSLLKGRIEMETPTGYMPLAGWKIELWPRDTAFFDPYIVVSGQDGSIAMSGLPAGTYDVGLIDSGTTVDRTTGPTQLCLKTVTVNSEVNSGGFSVSLSETTLNILLATFGSTRRGTVTDRDGKPVPGAQVALVPSDPKLRQAFSSTTTDQDGAFQLNCISSGVFSAYAWRKPIGNAYLSNETTQEFLSTGLKVVVTPDAIEYLKLTSLDE